MAKTVRKIFIVWTETRIRNHFARGVVHGTAFMASDCRGECGVLRMSYDFERALKLFGRLSEYAHSRDVGLIALHRGSVIDHHAHAFAKNLFLARTVGKGRGCPEGHGRLAAKPHFRVTSQN